MSEPQPQPRSSSVHPVGDLGALAGEREHRLLGRRERLDAARPQAGAVLEPRAEHEPEELGRNLVVLLVRLLHALGDGRAAQLAYEALGALTLRGRAAPAFPAQPDGAVRPDAAPDHAVGQAPALDERVDHVGALRGNQGTKALVSRW